LHQRDQAWPPALPWLFVPQWSVPPVGMAGIAEQSKADVLDAPAVAAGLPPVAAPPGAEPPVTGEVPPVALPPVVAPPVVGGS
jgi:hypothetical protein